jgi:putative salt-induced outer membrane protein YdiY
MNKRVIGQILPLLFCSHLASADTVELTNGDKLTGTVTEQTAGKIKIETSYAGTVIVDLAEVRSMNTDSPMQFVMQDGKIINGTLRALPDGGLVITGTDQSSMQLPGLASISSIGTIQPTGTLPFVWHGNAALSGNVTKGNTDTSSVGLGSRIVGEQKAVQRITGYANYYKEETDGTTTKNQYLLGGKYDRFFTEKWYGFVGLDFEKDKFKDLDLRSILSAGLGHQFYNTDDLKLSVEGGLSYTDDNFINADDNAYAGFVWGVNWEQKFFDGMIDFYHRHRGIQSLESADNTLIKAQTGARFPLVMGLNGFVEYGIDWNGDAPDGTKSTDHTYKAGVAYTW